jgi:hypothetical protein
MDKELSDETKTKLRSLSIGEKIKINDITTIRKVENNKYFMTLIINNYGDIATKTFKL